MVPYCVIFENDGLRKNAGIQLWLSAGVFGVKENPNPSPVENGFGSLLMVGVSGFEPEASWTRTTSMHRSRDARGEREPQSWRLAWYLNLFAGLLTAPFLLLCDRMYWVLALTLS